MKEEMGEAAEVPDFTGDAEVPIRRSSSSRGDGGGDTAESAMKPRSNSVKCGPSGPTAFDPEQQQQPPSSSSPRPKPKSLTGGFPQSRTGSKKVYYML